MRILYLHGFASGPGSAKGRAFDAHFAARGIAIERLDLRRPSLAHLRASAMIAHVIETIAAAPGPVILIGSSLGGLTAARVAAREPRVVAQVLLAPAFQLFARWRARLGEDGWAAWRATGWLTVHDYVTRADAEVDFGFAEDAEALDKIDGGWPAVHIPTWIFHGRADDVVDIAGSRTVAARSPEVHLTELDDDHQLIASVPTILAAVDRALAPWLAPAARL
ncbi:MAG: alpha/beta hydrolase [Deltaproteobacteria bacterium]|nr:alpha/beta hydrolase [Deltaproteobacteria bacterium]